MECLGGAGYVEESVMPRLLRESPLNSIWEGSGNVISLDVLRAVAKEEGVIESIATELGKSKGSDKRYDAYSDTVLKDLEHARKEIGAKNQGIERTSRRLVERMAIALQASLVLRFSPGIVSDAFISSRLELDHGFSFGTLNSEVELAEIVSRAGVLN